MKIIVGVFGEVPFCCCHECLFANELQFCSLFEAVFTLQMNNSLCENFNSFEASVEKGQKVYLPDLVSAFPLCLKSLVNVTIGDLVQPESSMF